MFKQLKKNDKYIHYVKNHKYDSYYLYKVGVYYIIV